MARVTDSGTNGSRLTGAERRIVRHASDLVARHKWADSAGLAFDDTLLKATGYNRDYYWTLGYHRTLSYKQYRAEYERGGIAERLVEAYPRATWSGGADIVEDPDPGVETPFEVAVRELFGRLDAWARLLQADILAGIGQYGVLLIGAAGELSEELPQLSGPDDVLYLRPYSEGRASIHKLVEDPADPRFGQPLTYQLKIDKSSSKPVHWSRVIHLAEGTLDDDVYGKPRLRPVWNYLQDLIKVVGGGSEAFWKRADPGFHVDMDPEIELSPDEEDALESELEEYQHNLSRVMHTFGATVKPLDAQVHGFGPNVKSIVQLISGTTGHPMRLLLGSERGEQASTQDRSNWHDRTDGRRDEYGVPVVADLIGRLVKHGALPEPGEPWECVWPSRDQLTESERAEVALNLAEANKAQVEATSEPVVTSDEIRDTIMGLGALEDVWDAAMESGPVAARRSTRASLRAAKVRLSRARGLRRRSFVVADADLANQDSDEPEWQAIHRAADRWRETVSGTVTAVWSEAADQLDDEALIAALSSTDSGTDAVEALLRSQEQTLSETLPDLYLSLLGAGADAALSVVRARGSWVPLRTARRQPRWAQIEMSFDLEHPEAVAWAREQSLKLITGLGVEAHRDVTRQLIAQGIQDGIPPRQLATRLRRVWGLRPDQVEAVNNVLADLATGDPGDVVSRFPPGKGVREEPGFRVRTSPEFEVEIPGLQGVEREEWARAQADRYAAMQRSYRARTIARTETLRALNEGQRQLWGQAIEDGQVRADQQRVWIATPDERTREEHAERHGVVVGVNEAWPWGSEPGAEPNCRCAQGLATPEDLERRKPLAEPRPAPIITRKAAEVRLML